MKTAGQKYSICLHNSNPHIKLLTRIPFISYIIDGSLLWPGKAIPLNIPNIQQIMDKVKSFIWLGKELGKIYSTKGGF